MGREACVLPLLVLSWDTQMEGIGLVEHVT